MITFRESKQLFFLFSYLNSWWLVLFLFPPGLCQCLHNTEGPSCERCAAGFHGNPFTGRFDDCKPCPCPGQTPCLALPQSGEVVCTHCPLGQRGAYNYWGCAHMLNQWLPICQSVGVFLLVTMKPLIPAPQTAPLVLRWVPYFPLKSKYRRCSFPLPPLALSAFQGTSENLSSSWGFLKCKLLVLMAMELNLGIYFCLCSLPFSSVTWSLFKWTSMFILNIDSWNQQQTFYTSVSFAISDRKSISEGKGTYNFVFMAYREVWIHVNDDKHQSRVK